LSFQKGHIPWSKGRTGIHSEEALRRIREARTTNIDVDKARELYLSGLSLKETGEVLGVSSSTISRRLRPLGIIRGTSETKRGTTLSPEVKKRMSEAKKKWCTEHPLYQLGKSNSFYGRKHSPETIEEMKSKLSDLLSGENNPQWRGGVSYEPYTRGFTKKLRHKIRKRDGYICQLCEATQESVGYKLCVHHIDYDKANHSPNNLISLCRSCHGKTHHNREYWSESLGRIVMREDI